jgi:predicted  nucleic acid-binding Zn-ribbon protein
MIEALAALYELQRVDIALMKAEAKFRALDVGSSEKATLDAAQAAWDEHSHNFHTTSGNLHDAELEQKSVEIKRQEFETKLYSGKVTAAKELKSISDEIEALGRQRARLDEKILEYMDEIEGKRTLEAESKATLDEAKAAYEAKASAAKEEDDALRIRIRKLRARRDKEAAAIAPALLKRYELTRATKRGVGIGLLEPNKDCSVCHTNQPMSVVIGVEEGKSIVTCENCGRILCKASVV